MDTLIGIAGQFYKTLPGAFKKKTHTHTYKHDPLILLLTPEESVLACKLTLLLKLVLIYVKIKDYFDGKESS